MTILHGLHIHYTYVKDGHRVFRTTFSTYEGEAILPKNARIEKTWFGSISEDVYKAVKKTEKEYSK